MAHYRIAPSAYQDMRIIKRSLGKHNPDAAVKMMKKFFQAFADAADNPYGFTGILDLQNPLRRIIVQPYLIFYRVSDGQTIEIVHIFHGARDIKGLFQ